MELTNDQVVEVLSNMTVMQLCDLTRTLETSWGVTAAPAPAPTCVPVDLQQDKTATEQTEWTVKLVAVSAEQKIGAIKLAREFLGLALKDAKDLIEKLPATLKEGLARAEADDMKQKFAAIGATIELV